MCMDLSCQSQESILFPKWSNRWWVYHADGSEGQQVVVLLAVAPGVPAGVLALLQDEHLTAEVHLLKAHKAEEGRKGHKNKARGRWLALSMEDSLYIVFLKEHSTDFTHQDQ